MTKDAKAQALGFSIVKLDGAWRIRNGSTFVRLPTRLGSIPLGYARKREARAAMLKLAKV